MDQNGAMTLNELKEATGADSVEVLNATDDQPTPGQQAITEAINIPVTPDVIKAWLGEETWNQKIASEQIKRLMALAGKLAEQADAAK